MHSTNLLRLLQLASPALPVGAYSYSEGLEFLVYQQQVKDSLTLAHWITQELRFGAIRLEAAVMVRGYRAIQVEDVDSVQRWNLWLSAARESEELRSQSWQMGRSLLRLFDRLDSDGHTIDLSWANSGCNFAIAYALIATNWQIDIQSALLGYLHSWTTNLIGAGIKLIPLGQTAGQQLLLHLNPIIQQAVAEILNLPDDHLASCGWGLSLASMAHETQYSRLFRS